MSYWGTTFSRAAALVSLSVVVGLLHNFVFSREGIGLEQNPLQAVSGLDETRFIQLEEAKTKWNHGARFIDARAEEFYTYEGHIRGALSLPYEDFERAYPVVEDELPTKDQEVVCYCSGFGCEESAELAKLLMTRGFKHIFIYEGGWPEWLEAGLPVERPSDIE
jgi:rhodanese-related sulfurtransferase